MNLFAPAPALTTPLENSAAHFPVSPAPVLPGRPCTVLVLGARGRLGYACVHAFAQAGWRVIAHVRSRSDLAHEQPDADISGGMVRWVDAPLEIEGKWQASLHDGGPVDVVVNAMAPAFTTRSWSTQLHAINRSAIAAAQSARALLLAPLSVLAYGRQLPEVLHESDTIAAASTLDTHMGTLRAQTELELRMAAESGLQVCTVRAGTYYGHPGDGWISGAVAKSLRRGRMAWLGPYDVATPWVYVHDLAQTLERVASQRHRMDAWTPLHFAGQQRTGQDWYMALAALATAHGWTQSPTALHAGKVPWHMWKPVGWFSPRIRALREMEYVWRTPHRLDNQCLLKLIGTEPRTDWLRSVHNTIDVIFPQDLHAGAE